MAIDVPNAPGVPAIAGSTAAQDTLATKDGISPTAPGAGPQWGVFKDGKPVVVAEGVNAFDFKRDWNVSDFQQERGAFATYNKVQTPFDVRVKFQSGGTLETRQKLLTSLHAAADSLELYDIPTPEYVYQSVNVDHIDYRRSLDGGLGILAVELWGVEVRLTGEAEFSSTKAPSGSKTQSGGDVQTSDPSQQQSDIPKQHGHVGGGGGGGSVSGW